MKAKDKAEELIEKFRDELNSFDEYDWILTNKAIQCALICVDEILEFMSKADFLNDWWINYYQQVKQEILNRQ